MTPAATVYVVILNWNGWRDTLACLDSVMASDYPALRVVVCDNGSTDGSLEQIRAWAGARCLVTELTREQAEAGAGPQDAPLVLIRNDDNLGFAGGNNVGFRHALAQPDCQAVWLLNNDTVVAPDALTHLVARLAADPGAGACGATLVDYAHPDTVQALAGARYNPWFGTARAIGAGMALGQRPGAAVVEAQLDYIVGACMLVTRDWLEQVGLLSEDYFLYYEEVDWSARAAGRWRSVYAPDAIVAHKLGASIGGPAGSPRIDALALRNRLRFTRRHRRWALPTVWLGMFGVLVLRLARRQWRRVPLVLAVMVGRWRWQP